MCDTLCAVGHARTLFAKNSDRPHDEVQVVETFGSRRGGGKLRTQYLEIDDAGAFALLGSRPSWLWGFEHGVNEHGVVIGNEAVYTTGHRGSPPALIGMDLVRLGLERGASATDAVDVITQLLERHGQGGPCYATGGDYDSSFLICDATEGWVVETSGTSWAAKRVTATAAISNRITLGTDWDRANVVAGTDFDGFRASDVSTGFADVRLVASRACLARGRTLSPSDLMAHLRDHGGRDGLPLSGAGDNEFTVCMHIRGAVNTTSAIVCELTPDAIRVWVAVGNPCVSVFVPVTVDDVPDELGDEATWRRFAALRDRVERDDPTLSDIRAVLDPVESVLADVPASQRWPSVDGALRQLGV